MRNIYSDLSPPIPKLHIILKEDYRNSIVDRLSMVFFVYWNNASLLLIFDLRKIFSTFFSKVKVALTFDLYNGYQERGCSL